MAVDPSQLCGYKGTGTGTGTGIGIGIGKKAWAEERKESGFDAALFVNSYNIFLSSPIISYAILCCGTATYSILSHPILI